MIFDLHGHGDRAVLLPLSHKPRCLRLWNSSWSDSACSAQKWMLKRASSDSSALCQYSGAGWWQNSRPGSPEAHLGLLGLFDRQSRDR